MMDLRQRYHCDVEFKMLVDTLEMMITKCQFTPTELREAAILAAIHHDQRYPIERYLERMRPEQIDGAPLRDPRFWRG